MRRLLFIVASLAASSCFLFQGNAGAVTRVVVAPAYSSLKPGDTTQLYADLYDANGEQLYDISVAWSSSSTEIATVDGDGLVTAVKVGTAVITASVNGIDSTGTIAVTVDGNPGPSSDELIEQARASGTLDDETALLYRVYAMFGDTRLPGQYRGDTRDFVESDALDVVNARWSALKPETRDVLEPFFIPPAYVGSWASDAKKGRALGEFCRRPTVDPTWGFEPATATGRVKVWYQDPSDKALAAAVAAEAESKIYDAVTGSGGLNMKAPLSDAAEGCNGGDGRFDIYLVDMAVHGDNRDNQGETRSTMTLRFEQSPTFMLLNRKKMPPEIFGIVAHEFTHASQWAYDLAANDLQKYRWLKEATANEAIDVYDRSNDREQGNKQLRAYLNQPEVPIYEGDDTRHYGSYLFFQYLVRTTGRPDLIGDIWAEAIKEPNERKAVDNVLPMGVKAVWPGFAKTLWNRAPITTQEPDSFLAWDNMYYEPRFLQENGDLGGAPDGDLALSDSSPAPNMSVRYTKITFSEEATRSLMFHNTYYPANKNMEPISVQAFWLTETSPIWEIEDWSDLEWVGFCRDMKAQRVKELVIVVASGKVDGDPITPPSPPVLRRSTMPCWGVSGKAGRVTKDPTWSSGQTSFEMNGTWKNAPQMDDRTAGVLRVPIQGPAFTNGTSTFDENYTSGNCTYKVASTRMGFPVPIGNVASNITWNVYPEAIPLSFRTQQASIIGAAPRAYNGDGAEPVLIDGTTTGVNCNGTYKADPHAFMVTQADAFDRGGIPKIGLPTGVLSGTFVEGSNTYTWALTPLREQ